MPSRFWKASGNALLPGKGILAVSGGAFTPASLSLNAWYEAGTADMYTDSGTTHVATSGDAVAQWNDKSGNGRNLTDVNAGGSTAHPLYESGAGEPYAQFDGSNDNLGTALATYTDGTGQHWIAISGYFNTNTGGQVITSIGGNSDISWIRNNSGVADVTSWTSAGVATTDTGSSITAATPCVLIATVTSTAAEIFLDNVSAGSTALTGTRQNNSEHLYVGGYSGVVNFTAGRIYGLVQGSGVLSSTDRASLQTYMAALHP